MEILDRPYMNPNGKPEKIKVLLLLQPFPLQQKLQVAFSTPG